MEKTVASRNAGEMCLICEEKKETGIHICHQFICESCEQELVNTDTGDASYLYYLRKLRNLCAGEYAAGEN
ncbi:MAG TPA: sigma factor G inhibitor Gin [Bacillales bacterium]